MNARARKKPSQNKQSLVNSTPAKALNVTSKDNPHRLLSSLALAVLVAVLGAGVYFNVTHPNFSGHVRNTISSNIHKVTTSPVNSTAASSGPAIALMSHTINSVIKSNPKVSVSVSAINLTSGQTEHYGLSKPFQAASTAKILTAEYFLHEVEVGKQSLGQTINNYTAQYELQQMIIAGKNNAWQSLDNLLGYTNLQSYIDRSLSIKDYHASSNTLSSSDLALSLDYLWKDKLLKPANTNLLLSYLQQTKHRQYVAPAIPTGDTLYNKAGMYKYYVNDASIIANGNKAFVLVIFTNDKNEQNLTARATMMQEIARAALKAYFRQS